VPFTQAGTGTVHSEYMLTNEPVTLNQFCIDTDKQNMQSLWKLRKFARSHSLELTLLVYDYGKGKDGALFINPKAQIYGGKLSKRARVEYFL